MNEPVPLTAEEQLSPVAPARGSGILLAAGALGFLTLTAQITLVREFLAVCEGNELIFGIVLGTWMFLTGAGAMYARYRDDSGLPQPGRQLVVISILPLLTAIGVRFLRNLLFTPGVMLGLAETLSFGVLLLAPLCLAGGIYFVRLTQWHSSFAGHGGVARVYGYEALGGVLGAFAGFILAGVLEDNTTVLVCLLVTGSALGAGLSARPPADRVSLICAVIVCIAALVVRSLVDLNVLSRGPLFPGQAISYAKDTPYGSLVVTHQDGQSNFFENGVLLFSTGEIVQREEAVHFAMAQRQEIATVLVISGGVGGVLEEVLKYAVERVDYVEVNPWIIEAGRELTPALADPRVRLVIADGRRFLRETSETYDVVLVNAPDPANAQANRFYTEEFFRSARMRMKPASVLAISLLPSVEYYGEAAREVAASVYQAQRGVFGNVLVVPGSRNYFLASDSLLDIRITRLVERRGIPTVAVNSYYLDDVLLAQRNSAFMKTLDRGARHNADLRPVAYYRHVALWLAAFDIPPTAVGGAAVAVVLGILVLSSAPGGAVFTAGFSGAAVEIMLLLVFQSLFGVVYRSMGLIFGGFMAGLAVGALATRRIEPASARQRLARALGAMAVGSILVALLLHWLATLPLPDPVAVLLFVVMAGGIGAATGFAFGAAAAISTAPSAKVAGSLYSADLAGSALGSLCAGVFLTPLAGVWGSAAAIAVLSAASATVFLVRSGR